MNENKSENKKINKKKKKIDKKMVYQDCLKSHNSISYAKRVARMGVLVALSMIFSYIEVLLPFSVGIPGVKLGIANLVVVIGLYLFTPSEVFLISLVRILLMAMLFGSGASLIYSLAGGILSFLVMLAGKKLSGLSVVGNSVLGAVFHNIGQIGAATVLLASKSILSYLPVLLIAGVITGMVIGIVSLKCMRIIKKIDA